MEQAQAKAAPPVDAATEAFDVAEELLDRIGGSMHDVRRGSSAKGNGLSERLLGRIAQILADVAEEVDAAPPTGTRIAPWAPAAGPLPSPPRAPQTPRGATSTRSANECTAPAATRPRALAARRPGT